MTKKEFALEELVDELGQGIRIHFPSGTKYEWRHIPFFVGDDGDVVKTDSSIHILYEDGLYTGVLYLNIEDTIKRLGVTRAGSGRDSVGSDRNSVANIYHGPWYKDKMKPLITALSIKDHFYDRIWLPHSSKKKKIYWPEFTLEGAMEAEVIAGIPAIIGLLFIPRHGLVIGLALAGAGYVLGAASYIACRSTYTYFKELVNMNEGTTPSTRREYIIDKLYSNGGDKLSMNLIVDALSKSYEAMCSARAKLDVLKVAPDLPAHKLKRILKLREAHSRDVRKWGDIDSLLQDKVKLLVHEAPAESIGHISSDYPSMVKFYKHILGYDLLQGKVVRPTAHKASEPKSPSHIKISGDQASRFRGVKCIFCRGGLDECTPLEIIDADGAEVAIHGKCKPEFEEQQQRLKRER